MPILIPLPGPAARAARAAALTAAVALLPALAGCASSPGPGTRQVASLPSATAATAGSAGSQPTGAGSGPASLQGPTVPDGASREQVMRLYKPWYQCLQEHGVVNLPNSVLAKRDNPQTLKVAEGACQSLQPHPPWQEMPAYNPHYNRDLAAWVNCINAHGGHVHAIPGGWTFDSSSAPPPPGFAQVELGCEEQAFHVG